MLLKCLSTLKNGIMMRLEILTEPQALSGSQLKIEN